MNARQKLATILGLPLDEIEWRNTEGIYTTERLYVGRLPAWTRANANHCWAVGEPRRLIEALTIGFDFDRLHVEAALRLLRERQRDQSKIVLDEAAHGVKAAYRRKEACHEN